MPDSTAPRAIFLNDVTYSDGQENPLEALRTTLAFAVDDWGESRAMSWVYGIVLGWDDDDDPTDDGAMREQAARHRWSDEAVERLRRLHATFDALADGPDSHRPDDGRQTGHDGDGGSR